MTALEKAIDEETHEKKALEIALKEEKACIEQYTFLPKTSWTRWSGRFSRGWSRRPRIIIRLIEDEYMHVMTMVDKSDQDIYVREYNVEQSSLCRHCNADRSPICLSALAQEDVRKVQIRPAGAEGYRGKVSGLP